VTRVAVACGGASGTSVVKGCLGPGKGLVRARHTLYLAIPSARRSYRSLRRGAREKLRFIEIEQDFAFSKSIRIFDRPHGPHGGSGGWCGLGQEITC
jgi:hypothetical protein